VVAVTPPPRTWPARGDARPTIDPASAPLANGPNTASRAVHVSSLPSAIFEYPESLQPRRSALGMPSAIEFEVRHDSAAAA